ncbi:MAG: tetratricopeptide repeat protein, partial [Elusimicrobia bacterium]|nr:tetratricopeptide repeat protein [Elusimicrobiota bacterium]
PNLYSANKHFRRGVIFAGQQKLTRAEDEFKKAIQKNPDLGEAKLNLGIIYMTQGLLNAAEKELLEAKDLMERRQPTLLANMTQNQAISFCLSNLAGVYAMKTSEAIQVLARAEAKDYYAKAKQYADQSVQLDGTNVRSQELERRLTQLETFLQ